MVMQNEKPHDDVELLSSSGDTSTEKLERTLTQFPPTASAEPKTETTETQAVQLTFPNIVLLGACANLTMLSSGFSFNAMSISLDQAARDLGIAEKDLQWTFNALYLAMVNLQSSNAEQMTRLMRRKAVYLVGIALFGIFSLVASFMPNPEGFFINRAVSGLGVAMILASNAGIIVENTSPGRTRSILLSIANTGLPMGNLVALGVVGPLIEATNQWRSAFWCLAGMTVLPFLGTALFVKNRPILARQADRRIDWIGGFLFTAGFALLFYPLSQARSTPKGWATGYIIAMLVLSFVLLVSALCWQWYLEHKTTFPPVIRPSVLTKSRGKLALVGFVVLCSMGCFSGFSYTTTIYYTSYQQLRPLQFALRFIPGPVVGIVFNVLAGVFLDQIPTHWFLCLGTSLTGLSSVLFALRRRDSTYWQFDLAAHMFSYGANSLAASAGYIYVTKVVKPEEVAAANGAIQFAGALGGCIGPALATLVYTNVANTDVHLQADQLSGANRLALLGGLRASYWFWAGLSFFGAFSTVARYVSLSLDRVTFTDHA
ncbi:hypothetical protein QFC22_004130 [Naganishia vaughanmartiniae]|uniref:Uncharacterized protein n=1 Tax=Naganishia vaughanmartiniae TaxID=1424756 RepID=A0ACC2X2G7_9TREE|nr:hypothetical protein QFC22_004130 [Naganishia vaughanmartiniae]